MKIPHASMPKRNGSLLLEGGCQEGENSAKSSLIVVKLFFYLIDRGEKRVDQKYGRKREIRDCAMVLL
jgi:hypothetical protein